MEVIDTHAHLNFDRYDKDREQVIKHAFDEGVKYIINIGIDEKTSLKSIQMSNKYNRIFATAGWHPHEAKNFNEEKLVNLIENNTLVAVGEIGLDYYRNRSPQEIQKKVFKRQIEIAMEYKLPIVVHDRDAHEDVWEILNHYSPKQVVFHCYAGDYFMSEKIVEKGWNISFTGVVTFDKGKYYSIIKDIPSANYFVETDAPFLTPVPKRGKRNRPEYVKYIIQNIARIKGLSPNKVADITTKNAEEFFGLN